MVGDRFALEPVYNIWDENEGVKLSVYIDEFGCVILQTQDKKSKEFYGDVELMLQKEQARLVADALLKQVEALDVDAQSQK